ncbi:BA14K family protein [Jiella mangrovi]|uniref:Lectin-like protein BA14k n=1 Tax=Jiella mangrovi TaxID=2821407 RepID=A0ABS4BJ48_9HYPH|nr:BA14K family protein [Jiella mangrovi]MBP0616783.1 BA14K family protein [Jiella mangrovi]
MKKLLIAVSAAAIAFGAAGIGTAEAAPMPIWHHHGDRHPHGPPPPHGWHHHHGGYAIGAGVAGLAAGAIIGSELASAPRYYPAPVYPAPVYPVAYDWHRHVAYCEAHHRYYDPRSNTYIGVDGRTYVCR